MLAMTLMFACQCARWPPQPVALEHVVGGLERPTGAAALPNGELLITEQQGRVRLLRDGRLITALALKKRVVLQFMEQGLWSVAVHPRFAENQRVFLTWRAPKGFTLGEARLEGDRLTAPKALLQIPWASASHHGGHMAFGPDGYLYVGVGSGSAHDGNREPVRRADPRAVKGTILRLDVDTVPDGQGYAVPPDNPFVGDPMGHDTVWAYGFRNPWRFAFDEDGALWVGDVGESEAEEVHRVVRGGNHGWPEVEGKKCRARAPAFRQACIDRIAAGALVQPLFTYGRLSDDRVLPHRDTDRIGGSSVVGGFVYRGDALGGLRGRYVFGDFVAGDIWAARETWSGWDLAPLLESDRLLSSFVETLEGELMVLDWEEGTLYQLTEVAGPR